MEPTRIAYKAFTAVFLLAASAAPALAVEPLSPLILNARYIISWSGITLGRINVTAREDAGSYSLIVDTKTHGVGAIVSDEASIVRAEGTKNAAGDYVPVSYHAGPQGKKSGTNTTLNYDAKGLIATRTRDPEDDPAWRPPVTFEQIDTAHDPITASFMLRRMLYAAQQKSDASVATRTYDGARLAEMRMTRTINARVPVMDGYKDAVNVVVTRTPIEGYTPKELKKFKKGDPEIHLYFTNDAAFLPIRASARIEFGELALTMVDDNTQ